MNRTIEDAASTLTPALRPCSKRQFSYVLYCSQGRRRMAGWFGFTQSNVLTSHGIWIQIMLIRLRMLLRRLRLRFISRHADLLWLSHAAISPDVICGRVFLLIQGR
jgi:hypothetical protein